MAFFAVLFGSQSKVAPQTGRKKRDTRYCITVISVDQKKCQYSAIFVSDYSTVGNVYTHI